MHSPHLFLITLLAFALAIASGAAAYRAGSIHSSLSLALIGFVSADLILQLSGYRSLISPNFSFMGDGHGFDNGGRSFIGLSFPLLGLAVRHHLSRTIAEA